MGPTCHIYSHSCSYVTAYLYILLSMIVWHHTPYVSSHPLIIDLDIQHQQQLYTHANTHTQKHYQSQAHHLHQYDSQASQHNFHINTPYSTNTLQGCASTLFSTLINIGGISFKVLVDTATPETAVAGYNCVQQDGSTSCGVYPVYDPIHSNSGISSTYFYQVQSELPSSSLNTSQSQWYGISYRDTITVPGTPPVNMTFGMIHRIKGNYFTYTHCSDITTSLMYDSDAYNYVGVLGLGSSTSLSNTTILQQSSFQLDNWLDLLYRSMHTSSSSSSASNSSNPLNQLFALQLCRRSGKLWIGGIPDDMYMIGGNASIQYLPMQQDLTNSTGYSIEMDGVSVCSYNQSNQPTSCVATGHSQTCVQTNGICTAELDTSSTTLRVPDSTFQSLRTIYATALYTSGLFNTSLQSIEQASEFLGSTQCILPSSGVDTTTLNRNLPRLRLDLGNNIELNLLPVNSWLQAWETGNPQRPVVYCSGITSSGTEKTILGYSVLNQYIVVYDKGNKQVGFSVANNCPATALNIGNTFNTLPPVGAVGGNPNVTYQWDSSDWSPCYNCSTSPSVKRRHVKCVDTYGIRYPENVCLTYFNVATPPPSIMTCQCNLENSDGNSTRFIPFDVSRYYDMSVSPPRYLIQEAPLQCSVGGLCMNGGCYDYTAGVCNCTGTGMSGMYCDASGIAQRDATSSSSAFLSHNWPIITGAVVGGVIFIVIVIGLVWGWCCYQKREEKYHKSMESVLQSYRTNGTRQPVIMQPLHPSESSSSVVVPAVHQQSQHPAAMQQHQTHTILNVSSSTTALSQPPEHMTSSSLSSTSPDDNSHAPLAAYTGVHGPSSDELYPEYTTPRSDVVHSSDRSQVGVNSTLVAAVAVAGGRGASPHYNYTPTNQHHTSGVGSPHALPSPAVQTYTPHDTALGSPSFFNPVPSPHRGGMYGTNLRTNASNIVHEESPRYRTIIVSNTTPRQQQPISVPANSVNPLIGTRRGEWQQFFTSKGVAYYYNYRTAQSSWLPPPGFPTL